MQAASAAAAPPPGVGVLLASDSTSCTNGLSIIGGRVSATGAFVASLTLLDQDSDRMIGKMVCWHSPLFAGAMLPLAACVGPHLPAGFAAMAAAAPDDQPARLVLDGNSLVSVAAGLGQGGLPNAVRTAVEAIAPGGELDFAGREWSDQHGMAFRVEKRYRSKGVSTANDRGAESFCSLLLDPTGRVLERAHSVPLAEVPVEILRAAMLIGRDVRRCEIESDAQREVGWRALVRDGIGRDHVVEITLDGAVRFSRRVVNARIDAR